MQPHTQRKADWLMHELQKLFENEGRATPEPPRTEAGLNRTVQIPWIAPGSELVLEGIDNTFYVGLAMTNSKIRFRGSNNTLSIGFIPDKSKISFCGLGNILRIGDVTGHLNVQIFGINNTLLLNDSDLDKVGLRVEGVNNVRLDPSSKEAASRVEEVRSK